MTIFDSIKYPISNPILPEEVDALPQALLETISSKMSKEKIYSGPDLLALMRRVIFEWEESNDGL